MRKSFSDLLYQYRIFFIPFLILIMFGLGLIMMFSKTDLFLWINNHHNSFFDEFFKLMTFLGDGITTVLVVLLLLFVKYRYAVFTAIAYAYSSLIVQILKRIFHAPRPIKYFEDISPIRTIEGYPIHQWNSFPSGHTASVFTLAVVLTFILKDKKYHWLILPMAALTAFSRVYLAQHFMEDIVAGAVLAVILTFQLMYVLGNTKWFNSSKLDGRLFGKA
ncbi:phosphatase PAP2 family protein [Daejeonella sp. H1SJ63]|uniref:phosphatase PAP2 family protein n=1 Tax=Daejeonella sp. H1SJ63 TaxID=3034145 RepID=UPI0023ECF2F3|nr:phosphatase PAP2 family protein [Daejeonella sp. H1SJ63]